MSGESKSVAGTVSGEFEYDAETLPYSKITKSTCVFWDVDDCPIPNGVDFNLIYQNIKSALANNGYDGSLEIKLYGEKKPFSDDLMLDNEITFVHKATKNVLARVMLLDILAWALDNTTAYTSYQKSYVMVMSQDVISDNMLVDTLDHLYSSSFDILLAQSVEVATTLQPKSRVLPFKVPSVWIWTSLIAGGEPIIGQRRFSGS
ncbi:hypothetical protein AALP_AA6G083300 [Arabis alpina]|uniref:NYN domain-containing protein n=1 Tax=Arabis alpina TaxID=50452 RepID=A0A087GMW2_ARAAL|nr:hypothetical protein AALP_AA6G083300 [Arabis alpina]